MADKDTRSVEEIVSENETLENKKRDRLNDRVMMKTDLVAWIVTAVCGLLTFFASGLADPSKVIGIFLSFGAATLASITTTVVISGVKSFRNKEIKKDVKFFDKKINENMKAMRNTNRSERTTVLVEPNVASPRQNIFDFITPKIASMAKAEAEQVRITEPPVTLRSSTKKDFEFRLSGKNGELNVTKTISVNSEREYITKLVALKESFKFECPFTEKLILKIDNALSGTSNVTKTELDFSKDRENATAQLNHIIDKEIQMARYVAEHKSNADVDVNSN